jgi:hypothetical protein
MLHFAWLLARRGAGGAALALVAACSSGTEVCTLIGCQGGLAVEFERPPAAPFRVEVSGGAGDPPAVVRCPSAAACPGPVFFRDFTAAEARVTVVTADGAVTTAVRPTYAVTRPNGPRCEPECRNATVRVAVPE